MQTSALGLTWNGSDWVNQEGSDTESDEIEPALDPPDQVAAILDIRNPPPLPALRKHAAATARAVQRTLLEIVPEKRSKAQTFALTMPIRSESVNEWMEQQFCANRREHTVKTALVMALNPKHTGAWARKQTGAHVGHMYVIKGLALHLRMHPFTHLEVQHACKMLLNYQPNVRRTPAIRQAQDKVRWCQDKATLEVAVTMVLFQRHPRWYYHRR